MAERVKVLVRAGVTAEHTKAKNRPTKELRDKLRAMVEISIVRLSLVAEKEMLNSDDVELLQRLNKLLGELEQPEELDPSKLSDEELAKRAK